MTNSIHKQQGMTLIELLIASTLGIIVSTAVAGFFLQSKQSFSQNDEISYMQDNGRYALKVLSSDIEMAHYWGGMTSPSLIDTTDTDIAITGGECGASGWTYDTQYAISYLRAPTSALATTTFPCVSGIDASTDLLVVKRVRGLSYSLEADLTENKVYLRTNRTTGRFLLDVHGTTTDPTSDQADWEYQPNLYFIENAQLKRKALKWNSTSGALEIAEDLLAEGIEQFHIVFGIDTNADEVADYFISNPTDAQLGTAVIARIYVLARSQKEVSGYSNAKSFNLGDRVVAAANDGYYRKVYSTSVQLRDVATVQRFAGV